METMNAPMASGVDLPLWGNTCPLCKFCTATPVEDSMPMLSGMLGYSLESTVTKVRYSWYVFAVCLIAAAYAARSAASLLK